MHVYLLTLLLYVCVNPASGCYTKLTIDRLPAYNGLAATTTWVGRHQCQPFWIFQQQKMIEVAVVTARNCFRLVFHGTFSTNRLYRAIEVARKYIT